MDPVPDAEGFRELLGRPPPRPPLEPRVLEVSDFPDHRRRLIDYRTAGTERVRAFLLTPRPLGRPVPDILAIHQDGGSRPYAVGKSEPAGVAGDPELAYGLELCRRGYVVLCPDRFGFESRSLANSRYGEAFAGYRIARADGLDLTEDLYKGCVANWLLLQGWSALGKELFELRRALDVLTEHPEVDGERLAAVGHSAGGFLTPVLMDLDRRVRVGCASCGTFLFRWLFNEHTLRPINGFAGLWTMPGLLRWGDLDDILAGIAPRPYSETGDAETPERSGELYGKARARYATLGVPERFAGLAYDSGHTFRRDMRERSYAWLDRWLAPA
jgi:dienelactone hydrolase